MRMTKKPGLPAGRASLLRAAVMSLFFLSLPAGLALAQPKPASPGVDGKPKAEPAAKGHPAHAVKGTPAPKPKPTPATVKAKPGTKPANATKITKRKARGRKRPVKFEMNPNAKWSCEQQTVSREPVWRGDKNLSFEFKIKNDGTEDLKIRAKGG